MSRRARCLLATRPARSAWGLWPTLRFPSPLIKPGVPISGTRLSDWLHRKAHGDKLTARGFGSRRQDGVEPKRHRWPYQTDDVRFGVLSCSRLKNCE